MQSPLRTLVFRYRTRLAACQRLIVGGGVLAAIAASPLLPCRAMAQRAGGEIGVSLTMLPPSVLQSATLAGVRTLDDGTTPLRTAPATTTWRTPVVTSRLSRDRCDSVTARHALDSSGSRSRTGVAAHEIERRVDVETNAPDEFVREVRLRREYFVAAGT